MPKIVSPEQLSEAYMQLNPQEATPEHRKDMPRILGNWLDGYKRFPEDSISCGQNWYGKVTRAMFLALDLKMPRTKKDALKILTAE